MSVSDGGRAEGSHKKVLDPSTEIHDAIRLQVSIEKQMSN